MFSTRSDCLDEDAIRAELAVMCQQERDAYNCGDSVEQQDRYATFKKKPQHARTKSPISIASTQFFSLEQRNQAPLLLSPEDRTALVQFGYCITDCCACSSCPRMVTEIAMNYFDRFLNTKTGCKWLEDVHPSYRGTFVNLIFLTAVYLALKVHGQGSYLPIATMARLSGGKFSVEQVASMEDILCTALKWRLNPPTSAAYTRRLLDLVPSSLLSESLKKEIYELSRLQLELAVKDYSLVPVPTSTLAYCSLKISLQSMVLDENMHPLKMEPSKVKQIAMIWADALPTLDPTTSNLKYVQDRFCIGIAQNYVHVGGKETNSTSTGSGGVRKAKRRSGSPRSNHDAEDDEALFQYSVASHEEQGALLPAWETLSIV